MAKTKIKRKKFSMKGGVVYTLKDLNTEFIAGFLEEITELYNEGHNVMEIAEAFNRDPDEIFIGLFHQARQGKTEIPFAYRAETSR